MIRLVFEADDFAPVEEIKEHLAMYLEKWHDIRLVAVEAREPEQENLFKEDKKWKGM